MRKFHGLIGGAAAALVLASSPTLVLAQSHDHASHTVQAAPVASLIDGVNIPHESFTLDNGLKVIVHEDRSNPIVAISVWYNVGSKDEPVGRTGFAHLFEHLMFGGSENAPGSYITRLNGMGATSLNGTTWFDRTNYFETVATPALEQALFLESDRMGHMLGAITQETLDVQRGVVQNEKRQGDNQPYGLTQYALLEALFPEGHPYRHSTIGSMADLDAASMDDVRQWFTENYGPNNAVVVLAGDVDVATARTLMNRYFGSIPRGPVNTPAEAPVPVLAEPIEQTMHDRVPTVSIRRYWPVPGLADADTNALNVAARVLGGLASSRLDNALVRGDQTAVSVSASNSPFHRVGWFSVSANVKPGQDAAAVRARLDSLVADFIANGPTEDEVARVVTQTVSGQINRLEQLNGRASTLAEGALYTGDPNFYRTDLEALAAVTPAQVRSAMQTWLTRPSYNLTVEPGAREAYEEAAATPPGAAPVAPVSNYQVTPRDPMPAIGDVAGLDFPDVSRARLSNGIEVIATQSARVPTTRVTVEFDGGWSAERADALGVEAMMLNALTEGAGGMDANQLAQARESLGASIFAGADMDRSNVGLSTVSANLAPSLDLLATVIRRPDFDPAVIERLRGQQLTSIQSERSSPSGLGYNALYPALYAGGYNRATSGLGSAEVVQGIDRDDLTAFHQAWIRPDNARIYVVSDRPMAEILPALEARFGDWQAPATPRGTRDAVTVQPVIPRIILVDRPQSPQSLILGGQVMHLARTEDRLVLQAGVEILGSAFWSRINTDLRETRSWSYGSRSSVANREGPSAYIINAPVQADKTGEAIASLIQQHQSFLGDNGVTRDELVRVRDSSTRRLAGQFETSGAVMGTLQSNQMFGRPDSYWEQAGDRYQAMTAEALNRAVAEKVDPSQFIWVVVGDAASVRPQLEALGLPIEVQGATTQ